jgi:acyl-CoA thioesterase FadM
MMSFYRRMLSALLRSRRAAAITVGDSTEIQWFVSPLECDDLRIMNASRIINLAEVASHYNNMCNGFFRTSLKHGLYALTRRYHVVYHRPVRVFRRVTVRSRLCFWNDKATVWHHELRQGETLCAEVFSDVRVRGKNGAFSSFEAQKLMGIHVPSPKAPELVSRVFGYE